MRPPILPSRRASISPSASVPAGSGAAIAGRFGRCGASSSPAGSCSSASRTGGASRTPRTWSPRSWRRATSRRSRATSRSPPRKASPSCTRSPAATRTGTATSSSSSAPPSAGPSPIPTTRTLASSLPEPGAAPMPTCAGAATPSAGRSYLGHSSRDAAGAAGRRSSPAGHVLAQRAVLAASTLGYLVAAELAAGDFSTLHGNVAIAAEEGLTLLYALPSLDEDWDRYEFLQLRAAERWALAHPDDPDVGESLPGPGAATRRTSAGAATPSAGRSTCFGRPADGERPRGLARLTLRRGAPTLRGPNGRDENAVTSPRGSPPAPATTHQGVPDAPDQPASPDDRRPGPLRRPVRDLRPGRGAPRREDRRPHGRDHQRPRGQRHRHPQQVHPLRDRQGAARREGEAGGPGHLVRLLQAGAPRGDPRPPHQGLEPAQARREEQAERRRRRRPPQLVAATQEFSDLFWSTKK